MKKFLSAIVFTALCSHGFAQNEGKISGSIQDGVNQKIINAATISLLNSKDSALLKTSLTDSAGNFQFEQVKAGSYLVMATSTGHGKVYSAILEVSPKTLQVSAGRLQLAPDAKDLKEVVVNARKQFIERKLDKTIINPDAPISNTGSTALEVLEKAPGVSVDKDGNISLRGKQGVIVMLDGKPSYMTPADLANFLRGLSSSTIDQIEVMTNPSAKYDASGNAGVINIKTKKNKQKGFNGSANLSYGQGFYPKTNNTVNLNYKVGKINLFGTVSGNYRKMFENIDIHRRYINEDKSTDKIFDQNSTATKNRYNYNAKVGLDFFASKKTTFGFVVTGYTAPGNETGANTSYLKNRSNVLDSIVTATRSEDYTWKDIGVNLNFRHIFDSTGREITADIDYLHYDANKDQHFDNGVYNPDWTERYMETLTGNLPTDINIYSAKIDYAHPLPKEVKLEAGLKYSYVSTDNNANYFNVINNVKSVDLKKTNHFLYHENINAAYINLSRNWKKWGVQAGLRVENTNYDGLQFGNPTRRDSAFSRSYTNAFPTIYISYNASEKNQYGFSFGRRINRPDYEDLNPFLFFLDKYTYGEGNPFLRPMYSNVFELSHTYRQFLTTTLSYNHTKDLFNETFRQNNQPDDSISTIVTQGNYGVMNNLSLSVNAQVKVTKWWTSMIYGEARYQEFKGDLYGSYLDVSNSNFSANINNQFNFKKGWGAELSGFYRTRTAEGQLVIDQIGQVSMGVKKDIIRNKGTLKLGIRDAFGPMKVHGKIDFQHTEASFRQFRDNRVATISFNYRFGKPIKGLSKRKTGGAGSEQDRIKSAN